MHDDNCYRPIFLMKALCVKRKVSNFSGGKGGALYPLCSFILLLQIFRHAERFPII